jgi:AP-4 complex subunit sigma-1
VRQRGAQAHFILDEMVMNGCVVETNRLKVLTPVQLLDKADAALK